MGRKRIGLLFNWGTTWTGGHYYLLNIIRAFGKLEKSLQPHILLFTINGLRPNLEEVEYEHLTVYPLKKRFSLFERVLKRIGVLGADYTPHYPKSLVDYIYPCYEVGDGVYQSLERIRRVFWLPDFQHKHLPHFFSAAELASLDSRIDSISKLSYELVLTSEPARLDYLKFYPSYKNELRVISFATILPQFTDLSIERIKNAYKIAGSYFISPNQFWAHKNHKTILNALLILKSKGNDCLVVFTGSESDHRNPGYTQSLKEYVQSNGLEANVRFLGFIDRREQLQLMNHAIAIVQPSLFEGWSTVVEDGKAMNQCLIVSDIPVHREQCSSNADYFDPHSPEALAIILERFSQTKVPRPDFNYEERVRVFSRKLLTL